MSQKIIVTGSGQSGTNWLADLLSEADNALVVHEPDGGEHEPCRMAKREQFAMDYVHDIKLTNVRRRISNSSDDIYIEVNSFTRYYAKYFPDDYEIIHHVRDGRDVVRSMLERKSVVDENYNWNNPLRPDRKSYKKQWHNWSNFQKACWFWWHPNRQLADLNVQITHLENLNNSPNYFRENFVDTFDLHISKRQWKKHRHKPKNENPKDFPSHEDWSKKQRLQFNEIAGALNKELGYEFA